MTEKQIDKWLRHRFSAVGWVLVVYYVLMNVLVSLAAVLDVAKQTLWAFVVGDYNGMVDMDAIMGNAWGYIFAVGVGVVILYAWKGPDYWRNEVMVKEKPMTAKAFFCVLSLCIGSQMVNSVWVSLLEVVANLFGGSLMPLLESVSGDADTVSMFLYSALLAPIAEELLFRGYILRGLRPFGKRFAIFGSAFLFGLFHGNLLQTPYAFFVGLVLGYVTVEYSIGWSIVLHLFNNLVLADLFTRLTAGLSDMAYNIVNLAVFGGFFLIGTGILIKNRRDIREYNRGAWMDRRCLKCFFLNSGILVLTVIMVVNMITMLFV